MSYNHDKNVFDSAQLHAMQVINLVSSHLLSFRHSLFASLSHVAN
jgi:hypothetical protein